MRSNKLIARYLNSILDQPVRTAGVPSHGWIDGTRQALGVSPWELSQRLHITRQALVKLEQSERSETITIASLQRAARAMDHEVRYYFVPLLQDGRSAPVDTDTTKTNPQQHQAVGRLRATEYVDQLVERGNDF